MEASAPILNNGSTQNIFLSKKQVEGKHLKNTETRFQKLLEEAQRGHKKDVPKNTPKKEVNQKLWDACYGMESLFIGTMLNSMRSTIDRSGFFGENIAGNYFRDMLYDEYARIMAESDQLGLARLIYKQLSV
ncbi:MAG: rod-binding protein [Spirochaetota bacterium]